MFEKKIKITVLDATVLLIVTAAGLYLVYRIQAGLHYRWHWSAIPQYLFRFDTVAGSWRPNVLVLGLLTTIRLSIWATALATIIGTVMGLLRVSSGLFNRLIGGTYVEIVRNLPPLVLVFIFYFFIGDQILPALGTERLVSGISGSGRSLLRVLFAPPALLVPFLSALVTLALFEGAYITEIVRSGIQSIEAGQWEAAAALGFTRSQQMRHIILPQAVQRILPPLAGQFISTIKDSAIVSVISIQELTFQGMELMATTYFTFEIWITITGLYLLLTLSCSLAVERLEIRLRKGRAVGRH
ncbi:MAG: amino acid ABC transporter permease [Desulfobacterales bacterium]|nr:amino acid ABC transporter permease [Desulfobacterales bacterium]